MQLGKVLYPVTALGPGERAGIWFLGCARGCEGCSNPELQPFDKSKETDVAKVCGLVRSFGCTRVTVSGGEPFLQAEELDRLLAGLEEIGVTDILVYTGYTLEELGREFGELAERILSRVTVLVDGEFRKELCDEVPLRGSSNQRVIVLDEAYRREYEEYMRQERRVDVFGFAHETHFIGIPPEDYDRLYAGLIKSEGQK